MMDEVCTNRGASECIIACRSGLIDRRRPHRPPALRHDPPRPRNHIADHDAGGEQADTDDRWLLRLARGILRALGVVAPLIVLYWLARLIAPGLEPAASILIEHVLSPAHEWVDGVFQESILPWLDGALG